MTLDAVYIYKAMTPSAGYQILEQKFSEAEKALQVIVSKKALWLLRESNHPGMLTIDYLFWHKRSQKVVCDSTRIALVGSGWISATNLCDPKVQTAVKVRKKISAETASLHEKSLQEYIRTFRKGLFVLCNRVNPLKSEATTSKIYSCYTVKICEVALLPELEQSITCEITLQPFKEPVVLKKSMRIDKLWLYRGRSYEREALEKLGIGEDLFIPNFTLRKVIDRIGYNNSEKLESLTEERLQDVVELDTLIDPVILPSGHSFSLRTIKALLKHECPLTDVPFLACDVIANTHLDRFIKAWTTPQSEL